jgi:FixJ family two-component response regulator
MENRPAPVVLVDDDASIRTSLARLFRSAGIELTVFASAEEFLASPAVSQARCAIVDVQMPAMSGLELQAACRRSNPSLPVILITASPDAGIERQALAGGAAAFLNKPFDGEELLEVVQRLVDKQRTGGADAGGSKATK